MFPGFDDADIKIDRGDRNFRFKLVLYPPPPYFRDLQINDSVLVSPLNRGRFKFQVSWFYTFPIPPYG